MLITQCHLTLCHPMDAWSPAGFSVHGILQARTLKWVASCFSRGLSPVQFSSVLSLSRVRLFATPWIAARQASLSITNSQSSLKLTSIESMMPSSHLILCRPLSLLPPIPSQESNLGLLHCRQILCHCATYTSKLLWSGTVCFKDASAELLMLLSKRNRKVNCLFRFFFSCSDAPQYLTFPSFTNKRDF